LRVTVEFVGLPELRKTIGSKSLRVSLDRGTMGDLLSQLERMYGAPVRKSLLDSKGNIHETIQVIRNGREWLARDNPMAELRDGDRITFLLMVAGG